MRFLLDDRLAPITSEIGFLEVDCDKAATAYVEWQAAVGAATAVTVRTERVPVHSLEEALLRLLPLASVLPTRALFVPTKGRWTAYFENALRGGDPTAVVSYLAKLLGCRGLRAVAVPNTITTQGARGRYGATILEIYGPEDGVFLNYVRSVGAVNDGGKWEFVASGTPQPFEEPTNYKARTIRNRFTPEMLERYVQALGVDAFNEGFYGPAVATLVEKAGALPAGVREYSLEEARAMF